MRLLIALSGGIDSVYLAENAGRLVPDASFAAAHCNFCLRGDESDGDEQFVRKWCAENGMPLFVKRFDTASYASSKGISIEMAARELRYEWFDQLCRQQGFDAVAVAHNANDNAETMILNLLRGSGPSGLKGMERRGTVPVPGSSTPLLRPMLGITRTEIEAWMKDNGKKWREDSSNASSRHTRNRIRNEVFPVFEGINPSFVGSMGRSMELIAQTQAIADDYFSSVRDKIMTDGAVDTASLLSLEHWEYVLWRIVSEFGIPSGAFHDLVLSLKEGRTTGERHFGPLVTGSTRIFLPDGDPAPEVEVVLAHFSPELEYRRNDGVLVMDAALFSNGPVVREWREGDWMVPLGMSGRKKLSDMFTDLKFSPRDKKRARVVEHPLGGGRVAALAGWRIDSSVKVTDSTKEVIIVKIK